VFYLRSTRANEHRMTEPAAEALANALVRKFADGGKTLVTWLNHYSARQCLLSSQNEAIQRFDHVEIDGKFLGILLNNSVRSSADQLIPILIPRLGPCSVALVGSNSAALASTKARLQQLAPSARFFTMDGYIELLRGEALATWLQENSIDVLIAGLGTGLQETFVDEASQYLDRGILLTCGGFLDQFASENYYPVWAYPLKLNWLVRIAREPRRLWRRYTVDAVLAVRDRKLLRSLIHSLPGYMK
jgi:beta-1,4-glucosyltransferase